MKLKRRYKWMLRIPAYLLIAGALLFVILYFFPFSGDRINRRIARAIENRLDRETTVEGARFYLSRGRVRVERIEIGPGDNEGRPLVLKNIRLEYPPSALFSPADRKIRAVSLDSLNVFRFYFRNNHVRVDPDFRHLGELADRLFREGDGAAEAPEVSSIALNVPLVELYYENDGVQRDEPLFRIANVRTRLFGGIDGLQRIKVEGAVHSELEGEFHAQLIRSAVRESFTADLSISRLLVSDESLPLPGFSLETRGLQAGLRLRSGEVLEFNYELKADFASLQAPGFSERFTENRLRLRAGGSYEIPVGRIEIDDASLRLQDSRIDLSGELGLTGELPFTVSFHQKPISRRALDRVKERWLPPKFNVNLQRESLELDVEARGALAGPEAIDFTGTLDFSGVALRHQDFALPLHEMKGRVVATEEEARLEDVSARLGGGSFRADAVLSGELTEGRARSLSASLSFDLPVRDALIMLPPGTLNGGDWSLTGDAKGSAELLMDFGDKGPPRLEDFSSSLTLAGASFRHRLLPAELTKIDAALDLAPDYLIVREFSGEAPGVKLRASGKAFGEEYFWKNPELDGALFIQGELEKAAGWLPEKIAAPLKKRRVAGRSVLDLEFSGKGLEPRDWRLEGQGGFQKIRAAFDEDFLRGDVQELSGSFRFDQSNVFVENVSGLFEDMPLDLSAELDDESLSYKLRGDLDMTTVLRAVPVLRKDIRATGPLTLSMEGLLAAPDLKASLTNFKIPPGAVHDVSGTVRFRGTDFAYVEMPSDLRRLDGLLSFSNDGLRFRDVKAWCGQSPEALLSGDMDIHADEAEMKLDFTATMPVFFLNDWTKNWVNPNAKPAPDKKPRIMEELSWDNPRMIIDGVIQADRIIYDRLNAQDLDCELRYVNFRTTPNILVMKKFDVDAYGGSGSAKITMYFPSGPLSYDVQGSVEGMALQPVLTALRGEKDIFTGDVYCVAKIRGTSGEYDSIKGRGDFDLRKSRFIGYVILEGIGKALNSTIFDDVTFTRIKGSVEIADETARFENVRFTSPIVDMNARGEVDFQENLDMICTIFFEKNRILSLPVLKQLTNALEFLGRAVMKFRITGTLKSPEVSAVTFSTDEIRKLF